jgi:signal transduction protein with GAF and PtsI domain
LDADTASVLLVDEAGDHLVLIASEGLREIEETEKGIRIPMGHGIAGIIAEKRKPMMLDDVSQIEVLSPFLRSRVRSLLGVPMVLEDRVIGVVHVGTVRFRRFTDADADLLQLVADRLALVVQQGNCTSRNARRGPRPGGGTAGGLLAVRASSWPPPTTRPP